MRTSIRKWFIPVAAILLLALVLAACSTPTYTTPAPAPSTPTSTPKPTTPAPTSSAINLNGAGATFPAPLYTKWFDEYSKLTGVKINYQAVGSGAGIKQITEGTVDFGASDGIMTPEQQSAAEKAGGPILHIPMTSGSEAIIYNLAGIPSGQLRLTGDILAKIYLKQIAKWNDSQITALNPTLKLPDAAIAVVHRSDGSGTTYIFTDYLSKVSADWQSKVGTGTAVNWPGDIGGSGNAGVAGQVQQLPNSIGYVELAYAVQNKLPWMLLKNSAAKGTDVREGVQVRDVDLGDGQSARVTAEDENGQRLTFEARFLVDASGRDTFLANRLKIKQRKPDRLHFLAR